MVEKSVLYRAEIADSRTYPFKMHPNTTDCLVYFLAVSNKQSLIRSVNFEKNVENDPLAYATHEILKPRRENGEFDSNQLVDLTYLCGTIFPDL